MIANKHRIQWGTQWPSGETIALLPLTRGKFAEVDPRPLGPWSRFVLDCPSTTMLAGLRMNSDAGYWIEEDVLSAAECDQLTETLLQGSVLRSPAGARHLMGNPAVATLAKDDGLLRVAKSVLGEGTVPFRATLFEKSGHANWMVVWHQDTALPLESRFDSPGWGPWSTKAGIFYAHAPAWALSRVLALRIHLDPSTSDNGPLRVIPGSHTLGVLTDEEVFSLAKAQSFAECLAGRGRCVRF